METPRRQETPLAPTKRIKSAFKFTKTFGLEIFTDLFEATQNVQKCIPGMKIVKCLSFRGTKVAREKYFLRRKDFIKNILT